MAEAGGAVGVEDGIGAVVGLAALDMEKAAAEVAAAVD